MPVYFLMPMSMGAAFVAALAYTGHLPLAVPGLVALFAGLVVYLVEDDREDRRRWAADNARPLGELI